MLKIDKEEFKKDYQKLLIDNYSLSASECTPEELMKTLAQYVYDLGAEARSRTIARHVEEKPKKVYYFSMEFLIGPLLDNYLINLGIRDTVREGLSELGISLDEVCSKEVDPGLGNGGLGRLAACFLDSMATEGISGVGIGLRYRFGLFRQRIESGYQIEEPDAWLENGYPWEMKRQDRAVEVHFGGTVDREYKDGKLTFEHRDYESILAVPYYIPIIGYGADTVNVLKLWKAQPANEMIDLEAFNRGDYKEALGSKAEVEAITSILYPNDSQEAGRILRLKQEYFMVSAGVTSIFRDYIKRYGNDRYLEIPDHVAIHTNDTHPAMCVPEMMRILIDDIGMDWDTAWDITTRTISFTNHTILPEAMEKWPQDLMKKLLPRLYMIIEEIDRRWRDKLSAMNGNFGDVHANTAVLWDGNVRMANLSIIGSHSVNGVARIHSDILKKTTFKDFYVISPEKFSNKTNGVTPRRFLVEANPNLTKLIDETIGCDWKKDLNLLEKLSDYANDSAFLDKWRRAKRANKERLADYISRTSHIAVDPDSIFDIQVKRMHAYKRQELNAFKVLDLYFRLKDNPGLDVAPCTFIFGGKAAPGYAYAKEMIKFICSVADLVNSDPQVNQRMKVVFIENFSLSNAQLLYPATDISEQISTAGYEASGTGNMKFMMNGAIMLGTLDGANIEIREKCGDENSMIFGLTTEEIDKINHEGSYNSRNFAAADGRIGRLISALVDETFKGSGTKFWKIYDAMISQNDRFFVLKDLPSYAEAWNRLQEIYKNDKERWIRMSIANTAHSGFFSSDRTIREYAEEIWHM